MRARWLSTITALALVASACGGAANPGPTASTAASSAAAATATATPTDAAAAVAAFYKGKTIRIVVGYQAGGGFDTTSRVLAQHIGKYIPGNPTVVVENMAGAGSRVAANWLYDVAPKDGTVIGLFNEQQILQQVLGDAGIKFDARKFTWLGSVFDATVTCIARTDSGFKSIQDVMGTGKQFIAGGTAPGANTNDFPNVLKTALGANIKIVSGYNGTKGIETAMNSGEVQGGCWTWDSMRRSELEPVKAGTRVLLVQQGDEAIGDFKGIPMASDLAKDAKSKAIIEAIAVPNLISKPFDLPPGVPAERAAALKDAFAKTMQDDGFKADCAKAKLEIAPKTSEQLKKVIDQLFSMDKATVDALKAALAGQ